MRFLQKINLDEIFKTSTHVDMFWETFFLDLKLSTHLHINYQPLYTWVINGKYKKLSTLKFKNIEIFILSKFTI
jgi:hypothetical protein